MRHFVRPNSMLPNGPTVEHDHHGNNNGGIVAVQNAGNFTGQHTAQGVAQQKDWGAHVMGGNLKNFKLKNLKLKKYKKNNF